jgi:archaellum component FlaF (FlaF/FlaG flagellin family)
LTKTSLNNHYTNAKDFIDELKLTKLTSSEIIVVSYATPSSSKAVTVTLLEKGGLFISASFLSTCLNILCRDIRSRVFLHVNIVILLSLELR